MEPKDALRLIFTFRWVLTWRVVEFMEAVALVVVEVTEAVEAD